MYNPAKPYKKKILKLIESTWRTPYVKIVRGLYPIVEKKFSLPEVQHTDGIGTKGFYHWKKRTFRNAVIDALAMNLNDLAMVGATPYALQNHIVLPKDDSEAILSILRTLVYECRRRKIAITGGETSIHNDNPGLDVSITVSGFIRSPRRNKCRVGDLLIGFKSGGLHSNGVTKVREIFKKQLSDDFTKPTVIYSDVISSLLKRYQVNGAMHITGGAFTKLRDIMKGVDVVISQPQKLKPQEVFHDLYKRGVSDKEMYSTFNCGVGYVISVPKTEAARIISGTNDSSIIGEVIRGNNKILIRSAFSGKLFRL